MEKAEQIRLLRDHFGDDIVLTEESGESEPFRIVAEFLFDGHPYAALQSKAMQKDDEFAFVRIITDGGITVETIEDDDEYEDVSEYYDDMFFAK